MLHRPPLPPHRPRPVLARRRCASCRSAASCDGSLNGPGRARVPLGDLFVDRDAIEWGVGADYLVNGFLPLLQVNQIVGPRARAAAPARRPRDALHRLGAEAASSPTASRLELRGVYTMRAGRVVTSSRASRYRLRDDLRLRVGYLAIGGTAELGVRAVRRERRGGAPGALYLLTMAGRRSRSISSSRRARSRTSSSSSSRTRRSRWCGRSTGTRRRWSCWSSRTSRTRRAPWSRPGRRGGVRGDDGPPPGFDGDWLGPDD